MVSGQAIGTVAVGIGTVMVVFGHTGAGMGVMLLGIGGAVLAEAASGQDTNRGR